MGDMYQCYICEGGNVVQLRLNADSADECYKSVTWGVFHKD